MKRTTIYLDPELEVRLKLESLQRKTPMADIIREALREHLENRPRNVPPGAGEFDSGTTDTSERLDEVLSETGFGDSKD